MAVYFERKGQCVCICCANFDRVWRNARAISLSLKDMRGPEKRGCAEITDRAFTALPSPEMRKHWWEVLRVERNVSVETIQQAYKNLPVNMLVVPQ